MSNLIDPVNFLSPFDKSISLFLQGERRASLGASVAGCAASQQAPGNFQKDACSCWRRFERVSERKVGFLVRIVCSFTQFYLLEVLEFCCFKNRIRKSAS